MERNEEVKKFLALVVLVVTAVLAFATGREVGRQEATSAAVPSTTSPENFTADTTPAETERCSARCGVQRWAVKTLSDVDRDAVQPRPVDTTIELLSALPRPASIPAERRIPPHETTIYRVRGHLAAWDEESDGDYHLVLF